MQTAVFPRRENIKFVYEVAKELCCLKYGTEARYSLANWRKLVSTRPGNFPGALTCDLRGGNTTWNPDEEIPAALPSRTVIYIFHVASPLLACNTQNDEATERERVCMHAASQKNEHWLFKAAYYNKYSFVWYIFKSVLKSTALENFILLLLWYFYSAAKWSKVSLGLKIKHESEARILYSPFFCKNRLLPKIFVVEVKREYLYDQKKVYTHRRQNIWNNIWCICIVKYKLKIVQKNVTNIFYR